jgi:hypothetical protein
MVDGLSAAERKIKNRCEYLKTEALMHQIMKLNSKQRDTQELRLSTIEKFSVVRNDMETCTQGITKAGANNIMLRKRMENMERGISCSKDETPSVSQSALYQLVIDQAFSQGKESREQRL